MGKAAGVSAEFDASSSEGERSAAAIEPRWGLNVVTVAGRAVVHIEQAAQDGHPVNAACHRVTEEDQMCTSESVSDRLFPFEEVIACR